MRVGTPEPDAAPRERLTLTLTATDRLARQLREDANLARARSDASVWEAPQIASFSRWLADAWTATWPDAQLLSSTQELVLWREAVERDAAGSQLLNTAAAAREARRADQLLRRHGMSLDAAPAWLEEHQAFGRWRAHVLKRMAQAHWLSAADLAGEVARLIQTRAIAVPERLELAGFSAPLPPAEQAVIEALRARGTHIESRPVPALSPRIERRALPDEPAQWRWVAQDIRERLRARAEDPPRILIALPDVDGARALAESVLRPLLAPWLAAGAGPQPWRWERGRALVEQPAVDLMLAILQLRAEHNAPEQVGRVLLSALLWTESERAATSAADYALRERGAARLRLAQLQARLPEALAARFAALGAQLARAPTRALPSDWAEHFRARLDALGWPGRDALDTRSYQAVHAARGLLDRLATLDAPLGKVPAASARDWLSELARATRFAPRVEYAQPVLITSIEEASALQADVLYVLDASAARLPQPARPTPFLPLELQRAAGIADATPERWLARTQAQVDALLSGCAPEVWLCLPRVDARGAELQPSRLFGVDADWPAQDAPRAIGALESALCETQSLARLPDADPVPAVDANEQAGLRADSALFKAWFESPFFAFCGYRLGIEPLPRPPRGLDARAQGELVHGALEDLWKVLRTSAALHALDDTELDARIAAAVSARADRLLPVGDVGAATRALEIGRAQDVVAQWLRHERKRVDSFHVEQLELRVAPQVASLQLRLRLDRVDRVQTPYGERWLVIDYKTGREADPRGWKAERPTEPQLPLYASHAASAAAGIPGVDGICFGHVKDGHPALVAQTSWRKRLAEDASADTRADWDESVHGWRVVIENAAQGFLAGEAWIDARVTARSHYAALLTLAGASADEDDES